MANGQISIRERKEPPIIAATNEAKKTSRVVIEKPSLPKYREIDSLLRSFDHKRALDLAIAVSRCENLPSLFSLPLFPSWHFYLKSLQDEVYFWPCCLGGPLTI